MSTSSSEHSSSAESDRSDSDDQPAPKKPNPDLHSSKKCLQKSLQEEDASQDRSAKKTESQYAAQPVSTSDGFSNKRVSLGETNVEEGVTEKNEQKEESSIIVLHTNNTKHRRKWDKFQFCLWCGEKKAKLARHLEDMHNKELEVAKILSIEINEADDDALKKQKRKERHRLFNLLRRRGNFNHNQNVLEAKEGIFIVDKRPTRSFLPCEFCLGFYERYVLKRHVMTCQERPSGTSIGRHIQSSASMLVYCNNTPSDDLKKILGKMIVDDVSQVVKGDDLILIWQ